MQNQTEVKGLGQFDHIVIDEWTPPSIIALATTKSPSGIVGEPAKVLSVNRAPALPQMDSDEYNKRFEAMADQFVKILEDKPDLEAERVKFGEEFFRPNETDGLPTHYQIAATPRLMTKMKKFAKQFQANNPHTPLRDVMLKVFLKFSSAEIKGIYE